MKCTVCRLDGAQKQATVFLNVDERGRHSGTEIHELCDICLDRLEKFRIPYKFPKRKVQLYEPGSFLYIASLYGIGTAIQTYFERLFHSGVSWYEASDLAEWLHPQIAKLDTDFRKIWRDFCVLRRFARNRDEFEIFNKKAIDFLRNDYPHDNFSVLVPKLRYLFQKYSSYYYRNAPLGMKRSEWITAVNEVKKAFMIFDRNHSEARNILHAYFWPYLEMFSF